MIEKINLFEEGAFGPFLNVIYYKASTKVSPYDLRLEQNKHMHIDDKILDLVDFYSHTPLTELFAEQYEELFHMMDDVVIAAENDYSILAGAFDWDEL